MLPQRQGTETKVTAQCHQPLLKHADESDKSNRDWKCEVLPSQLTDLGAPHLHSYPSLFTDHMIV